MSAWKGKNVRSLDTQKQFLQRKKFVVFGFLGIGLSTKILTFFFDFFLVEKRVAILYYTVVESYDLSQNFMT